MCLFVLSAFFVVVYLELLCVFMILWREILECSPYLRWVSASILTLWNHFHSSRDPDIPNLGEFCPCNSKRVQPYALETV